MRLFFALLLLCTFSVAAQELQIPALNSPVMDLAKFLSASEKQDLSDLAYEIHTNQGPQISILTVPDLQGYPIEEFSIRVAEKWKLGLKDHGNGLLIVISRAERKFRIEVGQGIEGEITDFEANQYNNLILSPAFKAGDFHKGLRAVMEDVAKKFNLKLNEGSKIIRRAPTARSTPFDAALPFLLLVLVIGHLFLRKRRVARGIFSGAGMAGVGFFMIPGLGLGIIILFIFGLIFGIAGVSNILYALASSRSGGRMGGGGFGGGSGGGWSGGGGGFSGGGSSGSW